MSRYERMIRRKKIDALKEIGEDLLAGLGCLMIMASLCIGLLLTH